MRKWLVRRPKGNVIITILLNKIDNTYSFVNLTKGHICECKFSSIEEALKDMDNLISIGKVIDYIELPEEESHENYI